MAPVNGWTVRNGDTEMRIDVTPDDRVSIEVTPPGPFVVAIPKADEVRIFVAAAIGVAHQTGGSAGPPAGDDDTGAG
jgi:hypothetical protein